jgi:hypothetical protein
LSSVALPRDARFVELRPESLTFRTREALLPGTVVAFRLVLEGQPLALEAEVEACLVVEKDRTGFVFDCRLDFRALASADAHIISLFIAKGRGSPGLEAPAGGD